jgi:hypothetical protein
MTFANYSELSDAVGRYLDRTDRTTEIQEWVRLVELEVGRKLNLRVQQLRITGTLAAGSEYLETPAGVLYPHQLIFGTQPPTVVDVAPTSQGEEFGFEFGGQATPMRASVWGVNSTTYATQIRIWPVPTGDIDYTLYYTTGIVPLTSSATTNYLLSVAADLYLYGCLFHGQMFDENPQGAAIWRPLFDEQIDRVRKVEWKARAKAGRLRMRPAGMTP